jgi:hypothetical protein
MTARDCRHRGGGKIFEPGGVIICGRSRVSGQTQAAYYRARGLGTRYGLSGCPLSESRNKAGVVPAPLPEMLSMLPIVPATAS